IAGIGIRFYRRDNSGKYYVFTSQSTITGQDSSPSWNWYNNGNYYWGADVVTTGGTVQNGTFDRSLMSTFTVGGTKFVQNTVSAFTVTARACTQTSAATINLALPPVAKTDFGQNGIPLVS
ncbi:hypothetical protein, partial [Pseudomonas gingeri]